MATVENKEKMGFIAKKGDKVEMSPSSGYTGKGANPACGVKGVVSSSSTYGVYVNWEDGNTNGYEPEGFHLIPVKDQLMEGQFVRLSNLSKWYKEDGSDTANPIKSIGKIQGVNITLDTITVCWEGRIINSYKSKDLVLLDRKKAPKGFVDVSKLEVAVGDEIVITKKGGHYFTKGEECVVVTTSPPSKAMSAKSNSTGKIWIIEQGDFKLKTVKQVKKVKLANEAA